MTDRVKVLRESLAEWRGKLARLSEQRDSLVQRAESQHWTVTDGATVSGIRRKPDHRADERRYARYDREAAVFREHEEAEKRVQLLERRLADAEADAARTPLTRDQIVGARGVRLADFGWVPVLRVNVKTVTVAVYGSELKRTFDRVLEVKR